MKEQNTPNCFNTETIDLDNEVWVSIINYDGCYEVSNKGRVKSVGRLVNASNGGQRWVKEKILKQNLNVELNLKLSIEGVAKTHHVSVLVGDAFLRDRLKGEVICQHDKNPENCNLENLIIMMKSESVKLNYKNGKAKDWGIGKSRKDVRKEYESKYGTFENGKLSKLKCRKCNESKPLKSFYSRTNNKRNECIDCILKDSGVKEIGKLRIRKTLAEKGRRICSICKKEKNIHVDFCKSKKSFMGRSNNCKECVKVLNDKYRTLNK
jgi:hypothetical protein